MRINLSYTGEKFLAFISKLDKYDGKKLVSFAFEVDRFDILTSVNTITSFDGNIFLFQSPDSKYAFAAFGTVIKLSYKNQSGLTESLPEFEKIKENFINNWNDFNLDSLPLICTSVKFDPLKSSEDWIEYDAINLYVPSLVFYKNEAVSFGCFNFIYDEQYDSEIIKRKFLTLLSFIMESEKEKSDGKAINENYIFEENEEELVSWKITAGRAMDLLSKGEVDKLVISRAFKFKLSHIPDFELMLKKLSNRFPDCYLYFIKQSNSVFLGSSPELFLKIFGNLAEVESVAGSAPRGKKYEADEMLESVLRSSSKNHKEHEFVTDFISSTLKKFSDKIIKKEEKQIRKLDNIQHLTTKISAELKSNAQTFKIIDSLFPTPAVCGLPKEKAMSVIRDLENHDRGLYSGLVGWIDFEGNCELAVAIRSTLVKNNEVTAFAGAGFINGSDPEEEFLETKLKLNPILSLFKPMEYE